jgi:hypothetical protein
MTILPSLSIVIVGHYCLWRSSLSVEADLPLRSPSASSPGSAMCYMSAYRQHLSSEVSIIAISQQCIVFNLQNPVGRAGRWFEEGHGGCKALTVSVAVIRCGFKESQHVSPQRAPWGKAVASRHQAGLFHAVMTSRLLYVGAPELNWILFLG